MAIEEIKAGDKVISTNTDTFETDVKTIRMNEMFDLTITFNNGVIIETFTDCFCESVEHWRLFSCGDDRQYLVICGTGIDNYFE